MVVMVILWLMLMYVLVVKMIRERYVIIKGTKVIPDINVLMSNIVDGDIRNKDLKKKEDVEREMRHGGEKQGEKNASRCFPGNKFDSKHATDDEIGTRESSHETVRTWNSNSDDCLINIDACTNHEDKGKLRSDGKEGQSHTRSRYINDQYSSMERKPLINKKPESVTDRSILDVHTKPVQGEISTSPTDFDCKYLTRTGVEQSSNVEEFGHMASGTIDVRNLSDNGLKRTQVTPLNAPAVGDKISASSSRATCLHASYRYHTQKLCFSHGAGSSSRNNRGKPNQHYKSLSDSSMRKAQQNAWDGASNWYSPVMNSSIPFQHGPPTAGCNLVMQWFGAPPIFYVRNSVGSQQHGVLYGIPNIGRFSSHRQPYGFHNPVDALQPSLSRGAIGSESHCFGRHDWGYDRTLNSGIESELDAVMFTGQSCNVRMELPSTVQNEDNSVHAPPDEEAIHDLSKMLRVHDASYWNVYFSKVDISAHLPDPQLYDQCLTLMDMEPDKIANEDSSEFHQVEKFITARLKISNNGSHASFSTAINDSIFKVSACPEWYIICD